MRLRDRVLRSAADPALDPTGRPVAVRRPLWQPPALLRAIFLGDWHPILRDPLDLFRLSFVVGAVIFELTGDGHASTQLALTAVAVFVARMVDLPRLFDWGFCIAMFFNGWGDALHLFVNWSWYDNVVHVTLPCFFAPMVYIADGFLGSLVGALLLCLWALGRFSSRRSVRDARGHLGTTPADPSQRPRKDAWQP